MQQNAGIPKEQRWWQLASTTMPQEVQAEGKNEDEEKKEKNKNWNFPFY